MCVGLGEDGCQSDLVLLLALVIHRVREKEERVLIEFVRENVGY